MLLEGLNKGLPRLGVTRRRKNDTSIKIEEEGNGSVSNGSGGGGACGPGCCKAEGGCGNGKEEKEQPQFEYLQRKVDIAAHPSARKQ